MYFLSSIEKSTTGTIIRTSFRRALTLVLPHTPIPKLPLQARCCRNRGQKGGRDVRVHRTSGLAELSSTFVSALVTAGQCRRHASSGRQVSKIRGEEKILERGRSWSAKPTFFSGRRRAHTSEGETKESNELEVVDNQRSAGETVPQTSTPPASEFSYVEAEEDFEDEEDHRLSDIRLTITKEELQALVSQYDDYTRPPITEPQPSISGVEPTKLREPSTLDYSIAYGIQMGESGYHEWPAKPYVWPAYGEAGKDKEKLLEAIGNMAVEPEEIFHLYKQLPPPRIPYLHWRERVALVKRLGHVERKQKNETSMMTYFSVMEDIKDCGIAIPTWQYNLAISFATACVTRITDIELASGLKIWRNMERVLGVSGNPATFSILFDAAAKAGKFALAEKIYKEMQKRELDFNRFHHVSLIYYNALKGDSPGVRLAYRDLVECGEIVDTTVLNAMIKAFIMLGEPTSADHVYARMQEWHAQRVDQKLPPRDFTSRRAVNRVLIHLAERARNAPKLLKRYQMKSSIAPDAKTYSAMVKHSAETAGDLEKTTRLLSDMEIYEVPLQGGIFLSLFKGFYRHGGIRYSRWTHDRLEKVWTSFDHAVRNRTEGVVISRWTVIFSLLAFAKVSGTKRAMQVYAEIQEIYVPSDDSEKHHVDSVVMSIAKADRDPSIDI